MAATAAKNNQIAPVANSTPANVPQENMSERFTKMVIGEFAGNVGEIKITDAQRQLVRGYFIVIDRAIKTTEAERVRKNESNKDHYFDNNVPCNWNNVNLRDLALDVVHYARLGLDMMQKNFLFPILFANKKNNNYDVNLMLGYNGIKYIAHKYAATPPRSVRVEVVYSTDRFIPYKKGRANGIESYDFEITNPFDRGEIIGGFGYIEYDDPEKNELVIMSMKDIEKRKPEYASANFWGGKAKIWKTIDGKRKQVEEDIDGWLDEMCRKTIIREVYSPKHILLDPGKVDENYNYMRQREAQFEEQMNSMQQVIDVTANTVPIENVAPELPAPMPQAPPALPEKTGGWAASDVRSTIMRETGDTVNIKQPSPAAAAPKKAAASQPDIFSQPPDDVPFPDDDDAFAGMKF